MSNGFVQGTTHVTYVRKKGKQRDRRKCIYYKGDGNCGSVSKCIGSTHCSMYITEEEYAKKKKREMILRQRKEIKVKKEQQRKSKRKDN